MQRCAGGDAHQQAFGGRHQPGCGIGFLLGHGDDLVKYAQVEHIRHEVRADAHQPVWAGLASAEQGRCGRLHADDAALRRMLAQVPSRAGDGAARAHAGNEHVDVPVGVADKFRAGGQLVRHGVGGVGKLTGDPTAGHVLGDLLRLADGARHALCAGGEHHLRAVGLHQQLPLNAHAVRHDDHGAVAARRRDGGQTDAGVAARGLDDGAAGREQALLLGGDDHLIRRTVLDRAGGVHILQLGEDGRAETFLRHDAGKLHKRRPADHFFKRMTNVHSTCLSRKASTPRNNRRRR